MDQVFHSYQKNGIRDAPNQLAFHKQRSATSLCLLILSSEPIPAVSFFCVTKTEPAGHHDSKNENSSRNTELFNDVDEKTGFNVDWSHDGSQPIC